MVSEELPPQVCPELLVCEVLADWLPPVVLDPEVVEELVLLLLVAMLFLLENKGQFLRSLWRNKGIKNRAPSFERPYLASRNLNLAKECLLGKALLPQEHPALWILV